MASDHRTWLERLNRIERRDPLAAPLRVGLTQVQMDVVVGGVPGDDQADGLAVEADPVVLEGGEPLRRAPSGKGPGRRQPGSVLMGEHREHPRHPQRTLTLVSIMSTTGNRWKGQPALRVYPFFTAKPPTSKEQYVERLVKLFGVVGSPGFERDEDDLREMAALSWDRGPSPAGLGRQLAAIITSGNRTADLRRITAPTLVIHGTRDRLVRKSGGRATARAIPGAKLRLIKGMGHDLPRGAWPQIIDAIAEQAVRVRPREAEGVA